MLRPLAVSLIAAALILVVCIAVFRRAGASVAVASAIISLLTGQVLGGAIALVIFCWGVIAYWRYLRTRIVPTFPTGELTAFAILLLLIAGGNAAAAGVILPSDLTPTITRVPSPTNRPNIYVLVLDGYPRSDTLQSEFGYDNSAFGDALVRLGFTHYADSMSPAPRTELTLLSMLGDTELTIDEAMEPAWSPNVSERRLIRDALQRAPATADLREAGYWRVHITSPIVHTNFRGWDEIIDTGQLTEFEIRLLNQSPLAPIVAGWILDQHRDRINDTLNSFAEEADRSGQRVVLAHVMAPHPPFVYGSREMPACWLARRCSLFEVRPTGLGMSAEEYAIAFVAQVEAVNSRVLDSLTRVINDDPAGVLVVMSDHGMRHDESQPEEWRRSLLAVRGSDALADNHSPHSLFGRLLRSLESDK